MSKCIVNCGGGTPAVHRHPSNRNHPAEESALMASEKVKVFTDANFGEEVKNGIVLVDFWATWCAPCRRIAPIVDQLAEEYTGKLTVAKVDIDENPMTPSKFMVRGIPTLLLFKNGDLKETVVGLETKDRLAQLIDKHL
ncbi:MAG: thioredoxin [Acidimicrobiia bacterium]|nr:thioredoxin [Acidimicrobiia bacterium]